MLDIKKIESFYKENKEILEELKTKPNLLKKVIVSISNGEIKSKEDLLAFINNKKSHKLSSKLSNFPKIFLSFFVLFWASQAYTPTINLNKVFQSYKVNEEKIKFFNYFEIYDVTSEFGPREKIKKGGTGGTGKFHKGIDFIWKGWEDRKIKAFMDGKVVYRGYGEEYGKFFITKHKIPEKILGEEYLYLLYAHCSKIYKKINDTIFYGEALGKMGKTGKARGIHLHLEARIGKNYKNKKEILNLQPINFREVFEKIRSYEINSLTDSLYKH